MKKIISNFFLITFFTIGLSSRGWAQDVFPFLAKVTSKHVNVRSGQSVNFESLYQFNKDDKVIVVGKEYSWYKIELPPLAKSFVHKDFVQKINATIAQVIAARVNVRAGKGIEHMILGQLNKGSRVRILEETEEWYKIEPVANTYGWISDKFLEYESKSVAIQNKKQDIRLFVEEKQEEKHEVKQKVNKDVNRKVKKEVKRKVKQKVKPPKAEKQKKIARTTKPTNQPKLEKGQVAVEGYLKPIQNAKSIEVQYQFIINEQHVYDIQGLKPVFDEFLYRKVAIEGVINTKISSLYPVILVSRVQLML